MSALRSVDTTMREVFEVAIRIVSETYDDRMAATLLIERLEGKIPSSGMGFADDVVAILETTSKLSRACREDTEFRARGKPIPGERTLADSRSERYHRIGAVIRSLIGVKNQEGFREMLKSSYAKEVDLHSSW